MKLRQAREAMGMTMMDVARQTNIELKYLMAIEKGEWDRLPNMIYARAYVKNYAQLVGEQVRITHAPRRRAVNPPNMESTYGSRRDRQSRHTQTNLHRPNTIHTKKRIARRIQAEVIDSNDIETPRKVTMPEDMPDPEEIGIIDEPDKVTEVTESYQSLPSRRQKEQAKRQEDLFGIWYTRGLITGAVLLVLGFVFFLYLKFTSPDGLPLT